MDRVDKTDVDLTEPGVVVTHALWGEALWRGLTMGATGENPVMIFVEWRFPQRFVALAHPRDLVPL